MGKPVTKATVNVTLTKDATVKAYNSKGLDTVLKALEDPKEWSADLQLKKGDKEAERVRGLVFPDTNNGHVDGKNGWKYQIDTDTMGKGSVDRLKVTVTKMDIGAQSFDEKKNILSVTVNAALALSVGQDTH